jgi:hypothetical protein
MLISAVGKYEVGGKVEAVGFNEGQRAFKRACGKTPPSSEINHPHSREKGASIAAIRALETATHA